MTSSRSVLITGCSTGIGRATASRLARDPRWTVYATARNESAIADLGAAGCRLLALDVTVEESMAAAVDRVVAECGSVDVLVNNAGYSQSGATESLPMESIRRQFETNVFGLVRMCQLALPSMRANRWGRIVNISSMGANFVFPGGGAYHATKFAVDAFSDALRFEVAGFGVGVTIVQPGLILTEFGTTAAHSVDLQTNDDDPYAGFNAAVGAATASAYSNGVFAKLGGKPDAVARVVARVIKRRHPPTRVRVTPSAYLLIGQRKLMTDRMWDRMVSTQFPRPIP